MAEWFRTWFDTDYYHLLYADRDENEARQFIDALLSFLAPEPGSTFIDIACGKGRHALQLSQNGFQTTGVDLSDNSIQQASQFSNDLLSFFVHDIRTPYSCGPFDYALNLFTSFGYFETMPEHYVALENIYNVLKPGGIFVFDYFNSEAINCGIATNKSIEINGIKFDTSKSISGDHIVKSINVIDGEKSMDFEERVMALSFVEIQKMLEAIGFEMISFHGNYQLEEYHSEQPRVIIIAKKN